MPLDDDIKDAVPERDNSAGTTTLRLNDAVVNELKTEAGVTQNKEVAPLAMAAIKEYVGDSDGAEEYEQAFVEQFEDE